MSKQRRRSRDRALAGAPIRLPLLILKLALTPLLIAVVTIAARRWGPAVGGWLAGLPLTSGPVSVFLAIEQGPRFAGEAAEGTLLGLPAVAAFCLVYAGSARRVPWPVSAVLGLIAFAVVAWLASWLSTSLPVLSAIVLALLIVAMFAFHMPAPESRQSAPLRWDLSLRMATATAMVLLITAAADTLGPKWSGLLSPFPVFACVMAVFAHRQAGADTARRVLGGVLLGSFAFASFFLAVGLLIERQALVPAYALAAATALLVNGLTLATLVRGHGPTDTDSVN